MNARRCSITEQWIVGQKSYNNSRFLGWKEENISDNNLSQLGTNMVYLSELGFIGLMDKMDCVIHVGLITFSLRLLFASLYRYHIYL